MSKQTRKVKVIEDKKEAEMLGMRTVDAMEQLSATIKLLNDAILVFQHQPGKVTEDDENMIRQIDAHGKALAAQFDSLTLLTTENPDSVLADTTPVESAKPVE